eukprot:9593543-Alexandrium_andersonii.AAC.1
MLRATFKRAHALARSEGVASPWMNASLRFSKSSNDAAVDADGEAEEASGVPRGVGEALAEEAPARDGAGP